MIDKMRIMHAAFFTPLANGFWGLPILFWGIPGIGKSAITEGFARTVGAWLYSFKPGEAGEGGVGRVPMPHTMPDGSIVLRYPMPEWAFQFMQLAYGFLLVDEMTTATGIVAQAIPPLTLDRQISGSTLPKRVRIMAIANPTSCSVEGQDLTPPTANRYVHIQWERLPKDTTAYWRQRTQGNAPSVIDPIAEETRVLAEWPSAFAAANQKIAAFMDRHPDAMHRMPQEGDPNRSMAWPSDRSWDMAIHCLAAGQVHGLSENEIDVLGAGCVGVNAWQEFSDYMASLNLPDPAQVLDGSIQWAPDTRRLDITATVISACVALVVPSNAPNRTARAVALWTLLDHVGRLGARDLTHVPATTLVKAGLMQGGIGVLSTMRSSGFQEAVK